MSAARTPARTDTTPELDGALCAQGDGTAWFPEDLRADAHTAAIQHAKTICRQCPVRLECLAAGIDEDFGIWGGLLPRERLQFRARPQVRHVSLYRPPPDAA